MAPKEESERIHMSTSKTRRFFPSKTQPASEKQIARLLRDGRRIGLSDADFRRLEKWLSLETTTKSDASRMIRKIEAEYGKPEPVAPKKRKSSAKPKVQARPSALDEATTAKELAFEAAEATPVRLLDGQPLKGTVVIRFKGNTALGKAFKEARGTYLWTAPQESFDKAKAFAATFVSLVGEKNAVIEETNPQC